MTNTSLFIEKFEEIPLEVRAAPTAIIIFVTSKLVVFFIINILTFMIVMASGWEFSANNKFHHSVSSQFFTIMSMERNSRENAHIANSIYCNESDK